MIGRLEKKYLKNKIFRKLKDIIACSIKQNIPNFTGNKRLIKFMRNVQIMQMPQLPRENMAELCSFVEKKDYNDFLKNMLFLPKLFYSSSNILNDAELLINFFKGKRMEYLIEELQSFCTFSEKFIKENK